VRERIEDALKTPGADYLEIRIEESQGSRIRYRGKELEDIGRFTNLGGNVRAMIGGGWGFASFNDVNRLSHYVELAINQARLIGRRDSRLAEAEPVVDMVSVHMRRNPLRVPLSDKKRLLDEYNHIIWSTSPQVQTSIIHYSDTLRSLHFANSHGTYLRQEKLDIGFGLIAFARKDDDVQQAILSLGSSDDYGVVEGRHEEVEDMVERAVSLLSAKPVRGGCYTVVTDPHLAGVFVHEAFGHLSEADHVYQNDHLLKLMILGRKFGGEHLNIVDGAAIPGLRGSFRYDDEGTPSTKTYLIQNGVLVGRLHSRETAAEMGEPLTGNARSLNYRFPPIVRMTNTCIEAGQVPFQDMISDIKEGIYACRSYGGQTSMEMFTFSAGEARMIRDGQLAEPVRGVNLSGNVFETLANIEAVGNDLAWNQGGGCGKGEQSPLPVADGSPHIRIRDVVIGGQG